MRSQGKKLAQVARVQARGLLSITERSDDDDDEYSAALAAFGLEGGDSKDATDKCYLWPCNVDTFIIWQNLRTQWRSGPNGPTGLDYTAVECYLSRILKIEQPAEIFQQIQAMEIAALAVIREHGNH